MRRAVAVAGPQAGAVLLVVSLLLVLVAALALHLLQLGTVETRLAGQLVRQSQLELSARGLTQVLAEELSRGLLGGCVVSTPAPVGAAGAGADARLPCVAADAWASRSATLLAVQPAQPPLSLQARITRLTSAAGGGQPLRLSEVRASSALAVRSDLFELGVELQQGSLSAAAALGVAAWTARERAGTPPESLPPPEEGLP